MYSATHRTWAITECRNVGTYLPNNNGSWKFLQIILGIFSFFLTVLLHFICFYQLQLISIKKCPKNWKNAKNRGSVIPSPILLLNKGTLNLQKIIEHSADRFAERGTFGGSLDVQGVL